MGEETAEQIVERQKEALNDEQSNVNPEVTDPADDFTPPAETPEPHDDVDVALQEGKDTQDGKGDDEVPEADFQGYADPSADKQEDNS